MQAAVGKCSDSGRRSPHYGICIVTKSLSLYRTGIRKELVKILKREDPSRTAITLPFAARTRVPPVPSSAHAWHACVCMLLLVALFRHRPGGTFNNHAVVNGYTRFIGPESEGHSSTRNSGKAHTDISLTRLITQSTMYMG